MIGAMQAHISVAAVQRAGCGALRNLASNASNRMKIGSLGGIEAVLAAMGAHRTFAAVSHQPSFYQLTNDVARMMFGVVLRHVTHHVPTYNDGSASHCHAGAKGWRGRIVETQCESGELPGNC